MSSCVCQNVTHFIYEGERGRQLPRFLAVLAGAQPPLPPLPPPVLGPAWPASPVADSEQQSGERSQAALHDRAYGKGCQNGGNSRSCYAEGKHTTKRKHFSCSIPLTLHQQCIINKMDTQTLARMSSTA